MIYKLDYKKGIFWEYGQIIIVAGERDKNWKTLLTVDGRYFH